MTTGAIAGLAALLAAASAHGSGESISLSTFDVPPGGSVTVTFQVQVDNPLNTCASAVTNQGSLQRPSVSPVLTDDPDIAGAANPTVTGLDVVDLAITKNDGASTEIPGTPITYTIVASNAGPAPAVGATVNDTFPAAITGVTWTCVGAGGGTCPASGSGDIAASVNLPVGGSVTFTATGTISASATGTLANTATVTKPAASLECNLANNSATDTDTLTPQVDLAITKTNGVTSVNAGDPVTYTIAVSNSGPSDAVGATVADTFPAALTGVTWTCSATPSSSCTAAGSGNLSDTVTVRAGGTVTYTVSATVAPAATGTLSNTATVAAPGGATDTNAGNNSATDGPDTIVPVADLSITKTDTPDPAVAGLSLTYTIVAANAGPAPATGATVADTFPATLTCTWTCVGAGGGSCPASGSGNLAASVNLPAGGSATFTVACTIADNATGPISNTATISGGGVTDNVPGNNSATATTALRTLDFGDAPDSDLGPPWAYPTELAADGARHGIVTGFFLGAQLDAEADGQPTIDADGDDQISGPNVDDEDGVTLPAFLVACESANVTVNASAIGRLDAFVDFNRDGDFTDPGEKVFDNQALVAGANALAFTVPCAATPTAKTFARFRFSTAGGLGAADVAADGEVEDYPVAIRGLDFGDAPDPSYPTLFASNGARHVVTGSGPILGALIDAEANGQPTAGATGDDANGIDDEDGVAFTSPLLRGQTASVTVTASAPGVLRAWIDFNGDGAFTQTGDLILNDQAVVAGPNNLTFNVPLSATSNLSTVARFRLSTSGGLASTGLANDGEVEDHAVATAPEADLAITKTDGSATEVPGTSVTYTITVTNNGPDAVTGATVTDTFPAAITGVTWTCVGAGGGTCTAAGSGNLSESVNLPASATVTFTATGTISASATGTLVNTATVAASVTDPNPANNSATDTDTLTPEADLTITKTDGVTTEVPGTGIAYTIVASNAGPSDVPSATVADTFPATITGVTWTCVGAGGGSCPASGSGNLNAAVSLPVGASVTFTASGTISAAATGTLSNTATVSSAITDPTPGNNSATDTDTLSPQIDLAVTKTNGVTSVNAGAVTVYTIVVSNSGPSDALGASVTDTFPAEISAATWTCTPAGTSSCTAAGSGNLNDTATVRAGSSVTYTVNATVSGTATGTLTNTVTVAGTGDSNAGNNSATDGPDTIIPIADLSITKTDSPDPAVPGLTVTYTIVAANAGPATATGAIVADTFPAGLTCTWTCVGAGGASCAASGSGNLNESVNLPASGTATFTATCTIADNATGSLSNTASISGGGVTDNVPANNTASTTTALRTLDFGDAPDSDLGPPWAYPTELAADGARHGVVTGFRLGAQLDAEADGQPTANADGDDQVAGPNVDDEDGVTLPSVLLTCESANVTVNASAIGRLDAFVDFNRNGSFADAGEKVFDNQALVAGANALAFTVPCTATVTSQTFARFRFSTAGGLSSLDVAADGEVEDYPVAIRGLDFGDAPDPSYPTLVASNGARHVVTGSGPLLGSVIDADPNAFAGAGATGDDTNGADDEDGVSFTSPLLRGQTASVTVIATSAGLLNAWIDFNGDGSFAQTGDTIFTNQALVVGSNNLTFAVPLSATTNLSTVSRFRISTAGGLAPTGLAPDGEVEDHAVATAPEADLAITKTDGATNEVPGTSVTYTITVTNNGPNAVTGANVTDTFPAVITGVTWTCVGAGGGTCTAAGSGNLNESVNLPASASVTFTATGTISAAATGTLVNTASVASAVFDPNTANNTSTDTDTLAPEADLSITKTDGSATEVPGTSVTYTIVAANAGPSNVASATVADTFPATITGVTWTCVGAGGGTCPASGSGNLNATVGLPTGASVTFTATGTISAGATGTLVNTATVSSAVSDPTPANNSATDTDTLTPQSDLAITKTDGATTEVPGTPVTYTITVSNAGPSNGVGATVADTFPGTISGVTWTCVASVGSSCPASGTGNINASVNVAAGGNVVFTATGDIASSALVTLTNTATVTLATDTNTANNSATDTDTLVPSVDLRITKDDSADPPPPGQDLVYTLTVTNLGPSDATGVAVTDTLPAEVSYVSDTCGGAGAPNWAWTIGNLADGATATCDITVSIVTVQPEISNTASVDGNEDDPVPGNNSDTELTQLDATPPEVTTITSFESDGAFSECNTVRTGVKEVSVTFSEDLSAVSASDPASATNPANYKLVAPAAGAAFTTTSCTNAPGTDTVIPVEVVGYDTGTDITLLDVNGTEPLADGIYRLLVCGTLEDLAGNPLDGGTGPGADRVVTFRVDRRNFLDDGHFDRYAPECDLGTSAWSSTNPAQVEESTLDAAVSPLSGSAGNFANNLGFDLSQCVAVPDETELEVAAAVRVQSVTPPGPISFNIACQYFAGLSCQGASLGTQTFPAAVSNTAGAFLSLQQTSTSPSGALSARCTFTTAAPGGTTFESYLDDLFFGLALEVFADGFETGDTSAWSQTVQ